jgi:acrylyl-CoA reductase (NADPH)
MKAMLLQKSENGFQASISEVESPTVAEGEVLVAIEYSTLNYKDGLAITNRSPVVRSWPMVAGIDGAGTVISSKDSRFKPGDRVVHNGWGVGETRWGCLAEQAALKADWLVKLPGSISTRQAMGIGTAGYTAMLCVLALERHGAHPSQGEILVTGATGGVGSVAIALLSRLGFQVVAATGKAAESDYLKTLGAQSIVDRATLSEPGKPLQKERWAGVVDSVGSHTLVNAIAQTRYGGTVAACGLAQGADFPATVMPFILRGITLAGVDSVMAPMALREQAWERLATDLDPALLDTMIEEISMQQVAAKAVALMDGQARGRTVVNIHA